MDVENLYNGEYVNEESTFYVDEKCTVPYTGHAEEYFNGKLIWECDIVNGLQEGVEKVYYDDTGELERISEVKANMGNGLSFEYYKSGRIMTVSTLVNNLNIDSYCYDEEGKLENISVMNESNTFGINYSFLKDKIFVLRKKYDLEKINEEILKYGKPVQYGKPIY